MAKPGVLQPPSQRRAQFRAYPRCGLHLRHRVQTGDPHSRNVPDDRLRDPGHRDDHGVDARAPPAVDRRPSPPGWSAAAGSRRHRFREHSYRFPGARAPHAAVLPRAVPVRPAGGAIDRGVRDSPKRCLPGRLPQCCQPGEPPSGPLRQRRDHLGGLEAPAKSDPDGCRNDLHVRRVLLAEDAHRVRDVRRAHRVLRDRRADSDRRVRSVRALRARLGRCRSGAGHGCHQARHVDSADLGRRGRRAR